MKIIDVLAAILVILGAVNWGFIGIFDFNLVGAIFGGGSLTVRLIYIAVGVAGVYQALQWQSIRTRWTPKNQY